ncbi:rab-GTPase-TBC domain-containing protein [Pelagophyceae sp. CCMP2097]|nr:rab-GTPase-TBC domain-containing protein [Pelagophyceae sp. CCMP2097]
MTGERCGCWPAAGVATFGRSSCHKVPRAASSRPFKGPFERGAHKGSLRKSVRSDAGALERYLAAHNAARPSADAALAQARAAARARGDDDSSDDDGDAVRAATARGDGDASPDIACGGTSAETAPVYGSLAQIAKDVPRTFGIFAAAPPKGDALGALGLGPDILADAFPLAVESLSTFARRLWGDAAGEGAPQQGPDGATVESRRTRRLHKSLARILNVGSDLFGYSQGMNFVAAALLVEARSEGAAFALYAFLLRDLGVDRFYGKALSLFLKTFDAALRKNAPRVHAHLRRRGFEPQLYAVEWFSAMFTLSMPQALSRAVFDLCFVQFPNAVLRVAVAVLRAVEAKILALQGFDDLVAHFKATVRCVVAQEVLVHALKVDIPVDPRAEDFEDDGDDDDRTQRRTPDVEHRAAAPPHAAPQKRALRRPPASVARIAPSRDDADAPGARAAALLPSVPQRGVTGPSSASRMSPSSASRLIHDEILFW